jgi:hypothetical protein
MPERSFRIFKPKKCCRHCVHYIEHSYQKGICSIRKKYVKENKILCKKGEAL